MSIKATGLTINAMEQTKKTVKTAGGTSSADKSGFVRSADAQKIDSLTSSTDLKKALDALKRDRDADISKIKKLETKIKELKEDAESKIQKALEEKNKIAKESQKQVADAIKKNMDDYVEQNKKDPGSYSRAQLASNINGACQKFAPNFSCVLSDLAVANSELDEMEIYLGSMNFLINDVSLLDTDIKLTDAKYQSALSAEASARAAASSRGSCDPIGFVKDDVRYDFIVDDGKFDSTSDFLGANNQWAEVQALDALGNGDGTVSSDEMKQGNIKVVRTAADGSQSVIDLDTLKKEAFNGKDFSIDLNSYKSGGEHSAIDTKSDFDKDGIVDQQLLGTFSINYGDKSVEGYNTLDDVDYLAKEYGLDSTLSQNVVADDMTEHQNFFNTYNEELSKLRGKLQEAYVALGLDEASIKIINDSSKQVAMSDANIFMKKVNAEVEAEKKAAEEAAKAEEKANEEKQAEDAKTKAANKAFANEYLLKNQDKLSDDKTKQKDNTIDASEFDKLMKDEIDKDDNGIITDKELEAWYSANESTLSAFAKEKGTTYEDAGFKNKILDGIKTRAKEDGYDVRDTYDGKDYASEYLFKNQANYSNDKTCQNDGKVSTAEKKKFFEGTGKESIGLTDGKITRANIEKWYTDNKDTISKYAESKGEKYDDPNFKYQMIATILSHATEEGYKTESMIDQYLFVNEGWLGTDRGKKTNPIDGKISTEEAKRFFESSGWSIVKDGKIDQNAITAWFGANQEALRPFAKSMGYETPNAEFFEKMKASIIEKAKEIYGDSLVLSDRPDATDKDTDKWADAYLNRNKDWLLLKGETNDKVTDAQARRFFENNGIVKNGKVDENAITIWFAANQSAVKGFAKEVGYTTLTSEFVDKLRASIVKKAAALYKDYDYSQFNDKDPASIKNDKTAMIDAYMNRNKEWLVLKGESNEELNVNQIRRFFEKNGIVKDGKFDEKAFETWFKNNNEALTSFAGSSDNKSGYISVASASFKNAMKESIKEKMRLIYGIN